MNLSIEGTMWEYYFICAFFLSLSVLSEGTETTCLPDENKVIKWTMDPLPPSNIVVGVVHPSGGTLFSAQGTVAIPSGIDLSKRVANTGNTNTGTGHIEFTLTGITTQDAGNYITKYSNIEKTGVTLVVYEKPNKPTIAEVAPPVVDKTMILNCLTTSNSLPDGHSLQINYTWFIDDKDLPDKQRYNVSRSRLQVKNIQKTDKDTVVTCKAYENLSLQSDVSDGYAIEPKYGPDIVSPNTDESYTLVENKDTLGPISCSADCEPDCTYQWKFNGADTDSQNGMLTINKITRTSAGTYWCVASNAYGTERSANVTVIVHYGPYDVSLTPKNRSYVLVENIRDTLGPVTCWADCNPECIYTWTWNNAVLDSQKGVLNINDVKRDKAGAYTCVATNRGRLTKTTYIEVIVQHGPGIVLLSPSDTSYSLLEKSTTLPPINCSAACLPPCSYTWRKNRQKIDSNLMTQIQTANRKMAGEYECYAENIHNTASVTIDIVVEYAPDTPILTKSIQGDIMENQPVSLICTTDSVPLPDITIKSREADGKAKMLQGSLKSTLTIQKAECLDTGEFTCDAVNKNGRGASDPVIINVMCLPRPDHRVHIKKDISIDDDDSLNIMASVIANPVPVLSWTLSVNDTLNTTLKNNANGFILYENAKHVTYTSHVFKSTVGKGDYGLYSLRASNLFGESVITFRVIAKQALHVESWTSAAMVVGAVGGSLGFIIVILILAIILLLKCRKQKKVDNTHMKEIGARNALQHELTNTYETLTERTEEERIGNVYDHITGHAVTEYMNNDVDPNLSSSQGNEKVPGNFVTEYMNIASKTT